MPVCFMIMPYRRKPTQAERHGPAEIDFNALWDHGYVPIIKEIGYEPVRADQDTGALIIGQMLERLYFADLVLADMTIPNGNVYYEVGIRHAAQKSGCVLLAADWSKQLFDVVQMRTVRYPLPDGTITYDTAAALRPAIKAGILEQREALSPMHQSVPGYPDQSIQSRQRPPRSSSPKSRRSRPRYVRCASRPGTSACNWLRRWSRAKERRLRAIRSRSCGDSVENTRTGMPSSRSSGTFRKVRGGAGNPGNPRLRSSCPGRRRPAGHRRTRNADRDGWTDARTPWPDGRPLGPPHQTLRSGGRSLMRSSAMKKACGSISTPIIAPAICPAFTALVPSRVTRSLPKQRCG